MPGEFHGQRSLAGYSPWGRKESDTTERLTLAIVEDDKNKIIMVSKLSETKILEYIKNKTTTKLLVLFVELYDSPSRVFK